MTVVTAASAPAVALPVTGVNPAEQVAASAAQMQAVAPIVEAAVVAAQAAQPVAAVAVAAVVPEAVAAAPVAATPTANVVSDPALTAPVTAAVATEPLTRSQVLAAKIEKIKAQLAKLAVELEKAEALFRSADALDSIRQGSVIVARIGRAETSKEVTASVVGIQTLEGGDRRIKIYYGEGFEADTVVIQDSQIVDIKQV